MRQVLYWIAMWLTTLVVIGAFIGSPGVNRKPVAIFGEMVDGSAAKPFVYRRLMPDLIRFVDYVAPESVKSTIIDFGQTSSTVRRWMAKLDLGPDQTFRYLLFCLLSYGFLWIFIFGFRLLVSRFYESTEVINVVTFAAVLGFPALFDYAYLYDLSTLSIYTLALAFLARRQWMTFIAALAIGMYSKETSLLLVLIYFLFYRGRLQSRLFWRLFVIQLSVVALIKGYLFFRFMDNPGSVVEFHFFHNLLYGYTYSIGLFVIWLLTAVLVVMDWKKKPLFIRTSLWSFACLFVLTLFLGFLNEKRDYAEAYPVLLILFIHGLASMAGLQSGLKVSNEID